MLVITYFPVNHNLPDDGDKPTPTPTPEPTPTSTSVTVTLKDENGNSISDMPIGFELTSATGTGDLGITDSNGQVNLDLGVGEYKVIIDNGSEYPDYDASSISNFRVTDLSKPLTVEYTLRLVRTVIFTVLDEDTKEPISDATVNYGIVDLITGSDGTCSGMVGRGTYSLNVHHDNYSDVEDSFTVNKNSKNPTSKTIYMK